MTTTLHIAGLDMSLAKTGWSTARVALGQPAELRVGPIPTPSVKLAGADYYPEPLSRIRKVLGRTLREIREGRNPGDPFLVAMEGPAMEANNGQADARAGLRWLTYHLLEKECDAFVIVPPSNLKQYATGKGGGPDADKPAMVAAAQRAYPDVWISDDNEADALLLAGMVARQVNHPIEASVQRCHPFALNAVKWPAWIRELH
jgi:hypothetical protein